VSDFDTDYTGERGNIPRFLFNIDFFESLYKTEAEEMMKTAEINFVKEE